MNKKSYRKPEFEIVSVAPAQLLSGSNDSDGSAGVGGDENGFTPFESNGRHPIWGSYDL